VGTSFPGAPAGTAAAVQKAIDQARGGNTYKNSLVQAFLALNQHRDSGFTYGTDGVSGILEPSETESWVISKNVIGWRLEQLGAISISELIHEETWES